MQDSPTQAGLQLGLAAALARNGQVEEARVIVRANQGHPMFAQQGLRRLLTGTEPRLVAARERMLETLKELGVP